MKLPRLSFGRFDRWMLVLLLGLTAILAGVAYFSNQAGLQPPHLVHDEVGGLGPIGLVFHQKMQASSVESRLEAGPGLAGRVTWDEGVLWFWPNQPLEAGREITVRLADGALAEDGQVIRQGASWTVRLRQPEVIFLSPAADGSEIWAKTLDGVSARKLTQTGNKVYDFSPSYDGQWIAYSLKNSGKGKDLWIVKRDGTGSRMLVDCSGDNCIQPSWSPDGKRMAYSRTRTSVAPGERYTPQPHIWTVELASGRTAVLFQDPSIGGVNPCWSPDGKRLAFFDPPGKVIHVLELQTGKDWLLRSQLGEVGAWSLDGSRLWYSDLVSSQVAPFGSAFVAYIANHSVQLLFSGITAPEDFGQPAPTPDGAWVAIAVRYQGGSHSVQLQIMRPDGSERKSITDDHTYSHGAYSWDPGGTHLIYQRVLIGSSQARPEVIIWDAASGNSTSLYTDAALPAWLP